MKNRILILFIVIIVIISIILYYILVNNIDKNIKFKFNDNNLKFYDRAIYLNGNSLSIGLDNKQLENGYYDFKIQIVDDNVLNLYFNKLFKTFEKGKLYDDDYLNKILIYINNLFNIDIDIKDIVLKNYIDIRQYNYSINKEYKIKENILVKTFNDNNVLKIEMRFLND